MGTVNLDEARAGPRCSACAQLRMEGSLAVDYAVTPAAGGGWLGWGAALTRLLRKIGQNSTQVLIIEQRRHTARDAQLLVGHGQAHAEASSNVCLPDDSHLCSEEENLLGRIWPAAAAGARLRRPGGAAGELDSATRSRGLAGLGRAGVGDCRWGVPVRRESAGAGWDVPDR